jgi:hypothetical protein
MAQIDGQCKGYFLAGENPAVGSANAKMQRLGLASLDWLVVRDFSLIESATWWKDGPEIKTGELRTEDIGTEVFSFPAAEPPAAPGRTGSGAALAGTTTTGPGQRGPPGCVRFTAARFICLSTR